MSTGTPPPAPLDSRSTRTLGHRERRECRRVGVNRLESSRASTSQDFCCAGTQRGSPLAVLSLGGPSASPTAASRPCSGGSVDRETMPSFPAANVRQTGVSTGDYATREVPELRAPGSEWAILVTMVTGCQARNMRKPRGECRIVSLHALSSPRTSPGSERARRRRECARSETRPSRGFSSLRHETLEILCQV